MGQHRRNNRGRNNRDRPMPEIGLRHRALSPYSEQVRLAFNLEGLARRSVNTPIWMPGE